MKRLNTGLHLIGPGPLWSSRRLGLGWLSLTMLMPSQFVSLLHNCFLSQDVADDPYMCSELKAVLGLSFKVHCVCVSTLTVILIAINNRQNSFFIQATCPEFEYQTERELREAVSLSHTHYMMQPFGRCP